MTTHYALVTLWNPVTESYAFIGGQKPITGEPEQVKADLVKAMRGKHGPDFVSVEIRDMPYQPSR